MANFNHSDRLKPTKQNIVKKRFIGFDIETTGKTNKFYCGSLYFPDTRQELFYRDKDRLIKELFRKRLYDRYYVVATNLQFDFFGVFGDLPELMKYANMIWRKSSLIAVSFHFNTKNELCDPEGSRFKLQFIDTLNHVKASVEQLGKMIGLPKLPRPKCFGKIPKDHHELIELMKYNVRDSQISSIFMEEYLKGLNDLGASFRLTVSSSSLSLFTNKYLDRTLYRHNPTVLTEVFKGYYGGRTEVFKRGYFENIDCYDINSMYPAVMKEYKYPDPGSLRIINNPDIDYIFKYEGVTECIIKIPDSETVPILPLRYNNKLLFPTGVLKGHWSNIEIREAIKNGAEILKIIRVYYYTKTFRPFIKFVSDLYKKRQEYKRNNNQIMNLYTKLMLNSLSGKMGERFNDKETLIHISNITEEIIKNNDNIIPVNDQYVRVLQPNYNPPGHCQPILAGYVTAYARLKLREYIKKYDALYGDTDSVFVFTNKKIPTSKELGSMKHEKIIKKAIFIKPKMYLLLTDNDCIFKFKGVPTFKMMERIKTLTPEQKFDHIKKLISKKSIRYNKITKFKESLHLKNYTYNHDRKIVKKFDLEDNKREWIGKFNINKPQNSRPLKFDLC